MPKGKFEDYPAIFFKGKIDRIDVKKSGQEIYFRLVDYKSGRAGTEHLLKAAVCGQKLQLPFYISMAEQFLVNTYRKEVSLPSEIIFDEASFVYIARCMNDENGERCLQENTINNNEWAQHKEFFWATVHEILAIIRQGLFPTTGKEKNCQWCKFATLCRKGHQPSRFRLENDERLLNYRNNITNKITKIR